jgi:hypothetical protein
MAFTQSDLDRINAAIASGTTEVRYADGSTVKYRSLDDMMRTRDMIAAEVTPPAGRTARNPRVSLATFGGLR